MSSALLPGSFDPPTNGHVDVIRRCTGIFDRIVVAVVRNLAKEPMFTSEERVALIDAAVADVENVEVIAFDGLLVDVAADLEVDVIVKGLRALTDFEYELSMAQMNRTLSGITTLFVATKPEYGYLSSSMVKEVARLGGSVEGLVPDAVLAALKEKLA